MKTSLITKLRRTNERTNKNFSSYRDHPLRGDLKNILRFFTERLAVGIYICFSLKPFALSSIGSAFFDLVEEQTNRQTDIL